MTMESMANYLTARGFVVDKKYDKDTKSYKFHIGRDGWSLTRYFKYPVDVAPVVRDHIQREFLDEMIEKFNSDIAKWTPTHNMPVSKIIDDIIKNVKIINPVIKGEDMGTRKINWKVERVEATAKIENPGDIHFDARLTGTADPLFTGYVGDVKNDLQSYLNKYMRNDDATMYVTADVANTWSPYVRRHPYAIKNVIFNDPATIVFWADGDKTVVKCQEGDTFDPEKGLAMAFVKKVLGNKGNYCNEIKKWLPEEKEKEEEQLSIAIDANPLANAAVSAKEAADNLGKALNSFKRRGLFT